MFRVEAVEAQKRKLHGDVFLTQPISFSFVTYTLVSIVVFSFVILFAGSYARSERVSGYLVPSQGLVKIQANQSGTLMALHVDEGDVVQQGQSLAEVQVSINTTEGRSLAEKNIEILGRQKTVVQNQVALEQNQLEAELAKLSSEKAELELRAKSLESQIGLQQQITASAQAAYEDIQGILEKGFISKIESERRRQTWLGQQAQERLKEQELVEVTSRLEQLDIRLGQLPDESKQRIARLQTQLSDLDARAIEQQGRHAYSITAPITGRVVSINGSGVGRSVRAGQPLLALMPAGSTLEAELFVPSRAAGFIEEGQEVRLLYDAFPYQRFGSYAAKVDRFTETIIAPNETLAPFEIQEPVYRVTATLNAQQVFARNRYIALQSGMTLQANIVLERRSFLDWLLEPLHAVGGRV